MAFLSPLSPLWLGYVLSRKHAGQRDKSPFPGWPARRTNRRAGRTFSLLLMLGMALAVSVVLGDDRLDVRDAITGCLYLALFLLASLAVVMWARRGYAGVKEPAPVRPGR